MACWAGGPPERAKLSVEERREAGEMRGNGGTQASRPEPSRRLLTALMAGLQAGQGSSETCPPWFPLCPSHLLAFGVAGGAVGLGIVLSLQGTVERLQRVLAEGVRAEVLAGVHAQPAAVLVTWHPGREKALRGPVHPPGQNGEQTQQHRDRKDPSGPRASGLWPAQTVHVLQVPEPGKSWAKGVFCPQIALHPNLPPVPRTHCRPSSSCRHCRAGQSPAAH